ITVTVSDSSGNPIPGATGQGTLLIGTPVTASLTSTPSNLPAGNGTVTESLEVKSQLNYNAPLVLQGTTAISGAQCVAASGNVAYVGFAGGIDVVDITDPTNPTVLRTFGSSDLSGLNPQQLQITSSELVVVADPSGGSPCSLLIYSINNPTNPTLLG